MGSSRILLVFYSLLLSLATLTLSLDDVYFEHNCNETSGNYTANSTYQANLNDLISRFSTLTEFNYGFFNLSAGESPDIVHAIALCRGDLTQDRCYTCLNYTAVNLQQFCPLNKAATAWSELCLVRYANRDMFGLLENDPRTCAYNPRSASNPDQFNQELIDLLRNLSNETAAGGPLRKYAAGNAPAGNSQTVYAMAQCTPDMDEQNCTTCLDYAMDELQKCCSGRLGCRILRPTCVLRFESDPFYNQTAVLLPSPAPPSTTSSSPRSSRVPEAPAPPPSTTSSSPTSSGGNGNSITPTVIIVLASVVGVLKITISPYLFL